MSGDAKKRPTSVTREARASCTACGAMWKGGGAQGAAALHHDETGHVSVAIVTMQVTYGRAPAPPASTSRKPGTGRRRSRDWRR